MVTNNDLNPNCYMVSKVLDMFPPGIIKVSMKADDFNPDRDNVELRICDYYTPSGDIATPQPAVNPDGSIEDNRSFIRNMIVNADGELEKDTDQSNTISIGQTYYYWAWFSDDSVDRQWRITLVGDYSEDERITIERLITMSTVNASTIAIRLGKSNKLKGKQFELSVSDVNGNYSSAKILEVAS